MWCKYITYFMIFDSKPGRVRHKFAQLQGTDPGLFLGGVHHVFKPLLRGGGGGGGGTHSLHEPSRSAPACSALNPIHLNGLHRIVNLILSVFVFPGYTWLPGCYWWNIGSEGLRQCSPCCSFILGYEIPKIEHISQGEMGGGGMSTFKMKIWSVYLWCFL